MPIFDDPRTQGGMSNIMQTGFPQVKKKPQPPVQDPAMAPMITPQDPFLSTTSGPTNQLRVGQLPNTPTPPGIARAWSSQGPADRHTPVQQFNVPIGPQPNHMRQPDPIGRMWSGFSSVGAGDSGTGGGGASTAADSIARFYDSIGMPLSEAIGGAQRDEELGRHAFAQRFGSEQATSQLQQAGMAHNLQAMPQNELVKRISELSTANLYNPTPEGTALIKHYMQQLQGMNMGVAAPHAGSGEQQEASTPAATPTNNHPGASGMMHAALHGAIPALAGGAGWAGGAAMAPETGGLSLLVPAAASAASYFLGNKLMDRFDPGGGEAASEHPVANIAGQLGGAVTGYRGFGHMGSRGAKATGGPAGTLGAEAAGTPTAQGMAPRPSRQMSPFGGGEVPAGQPAIAPRSRQLTMGEMGAQSVEPRTSVTTGGTPAQAPEQVQPFAPATRDPNVQAAIDAFKMPAPQMTQAVPGMQSTAMPQPRVQPMGMESSPVQPRVPIATNPVPMPQPPVEGVPPTLNPGMLSPQMLQQLIGDPRIGPAITHDPALQQLLQKYLLSPAQ